MGFNIDSHLLSEEDVNDIFVFANHFNINDDIMTTFITERLKYWPGSNVVISRIDALFCFLDIPKDVIARIFLVYPGICNQLPGTTIFKINKFCELFNVSKRMAIEACIKQPAFFTSDPNTLYNKFLLINKHFNIDNLSIMDTKGILLLCSVEVIYLNVLARNILDADYRIGYFSIVKEKHIESIKERFCFSNEDISGLVEKLKQKDKKIVEVEEKVLVTA